MGSSRTTRSGSGLSEKQEQFGRLIAQGMSNSEACLVMGINRRTGTRWRYGRVVRNPAGEAVHYPPMHASRPKPRHPRYLSLEERTIIADLHREKKTVREIAVVVGRSPATISRELGATLMRPGVICRARRIAWHRLVRLGCDIDA